MNVQNEFIVQLKQSLGRDMLSGGMCSYTKFKIRTWSISLDIIASDQWVSVICEEMHRLSVDYTIA